ncbi:MAG: hypothetical protein ABI645_00120 [Pseudomonadota bacterium]
MNHRYASLPLWVQDDNQTEALWRASATVGYSSSSASDLSLTGPTLSLGLARSLGAAWVVDGFLFMDDLRFSGRDSKRPLDVSFVGGLPILVPALAEFSNLEGAARHLGAGVALRRSGDWHLLGHHQWTVGLLWQRLRLENYRIQYGIVEGPDTGIAGELDYSATYSHFTPVAGLAWPREHPRWAFTPHLQIALPLPRRSVSGQITGPGFSLQGDTASNHNGSHFGDPSLTIGYDISYLPWHLTVDIGSTLTQGLLEPLIHEGIATNWLVNVRWTY